MVRTRKNKSFGMIVQEYRQRNGWTQEELAWRAGVTREHIRQILEHECHIAGGSTYGSGDKCHTRRIRSGYTSGIGAEI